MELMMKAVYNEAEICREMEEKFINEIGVPPVGHKVVSMMRYGRCVVELELEELPPVEVPVSLSTAGEEL